MKRLISLLTLVSSAALGAADLPYQRTEDFAPVTIGTRVRQTTRTFFFAETVGQYSLFQNFLHRWLDRPLYTDTGLRPEKFCYETQAAFDIARASAIRSGLDGFGVFGNFRSSMVEFRSKVAFNREANGKFAILPLVFYMLGGVDFVADPTSTADLIKAAAYDPLTTTRDGRKLFATYNLRCATLKEQAAFISSLHRLAKDERFAMPGDLNFRVINRLQASYRRKGSLTGEERRELAQLVDDSLACADGLHLRMTEYHRTGESSYAAVLDQNLLDGYLKDILIAAYAKPENRHKTLSFYAMQGYLNNLSGSCNSEAGTATLRHGLNTLLALNPDFILFFEWNEENESTSFQPTVRNGEAVGRILHYYSCLVRGTEPTPFEGDDNAVPNLTLSHRIVFKPGEKISFEILNVPSGEKAPLHEVQLALFTGTGRKLVEFPKEKMKTSALGAVTYDLAGEDFPVDEAIVPVLTVDGRRYGGFHPLRMDATRCVDYKCVRQSLRDQPKMTKRGFKLMAEGNGLYAFSADLAADAEFKSVELVCNEDEVAAYDVDNLYDREKYDIVRLSVYTAPGSSVIGHVAFKLRNAPGAKLLQEWKPNVDPGIPDTSEKGTYRFRLQLFNDETPYYLLLPKGVASTAEVAVEADATFSEKPEVGVIPVKDVFAHGSYALAAPKPLGFRVKARRFDALPDLPRAIGAKAVSWKGRVRVDAPLPVFHLRVLTKNGRVWRSKAIVPTRPDAAASVKLPFYSEWTKGAKAMNVPTALVPTIDYDFRPLAGAMLVAKGAPAFNATLGDGYVYCEAFNEKCAFVGMHGYDSAPAWVEEDGRWILRFDGDNDYVHMPVETFPVGAFTLETEFRPRLSEKNMVLFRHAAVGRGSLHLFATKGRLYMMWADRDYENPERRTFVTDTGLEIRDGEWNDLSVTYDFRRMVFRLNGKEKALPFDRRAYFFHPAVFGAHAMTNDIAPRGDLECFRGDLRKLKIVHTSR